MSGDDHGITPGGNPTCPKCGRWYGLGETHVCPVSGDDHGTTDELDLDAITMDRTPTDPCLDTLTEHPPTSSPPRPDRVPGPPESDLVPPPSLLRRGDAVAPRPGTRTDLVPDTNTDDQVCPCSNPPHTHPTPTRHTPAVT